MRAVKHHILFLILLSIGSCVDPFKLPDIPESSVLVVDGLITTGGGPHRVKLSKSVSLNESESVPVSGAALKVLDDQGGVINLVQIDAGVYQVIPEDWKAELGRTYRLSIELADGRKYESENQLVYSPGTIDSLYFSYAPGVINAGDLANEMDAFIVYMDALGDEGIQNLFRWRWNGTYEIFTHPELVTGVALDGSRFPAPLPCSGYDANLHPIAPCTCCTCWVTEYSRQAIVSKNEFIIDNRFLGIEIARIPIDGFRFYNKYYIEVEQLSLDESSYTFWKLVEAQQKSATNIFQPNVIRVQGNVRNVGNQDEPVLGVVSFASVTRASVFIKQSDIPGLKPQLPIYIGDCRNFAAASTTTKPPFW